MENMPDQKRVVTFGEVMLRLAPDGFLRLRQTIPGSLNATFGGGELNVAVSIALQGGRAAFLTAVPDNIVTDALVHEIQRLNVESDLVLRRPSGRFGIYFVETGANQRGGTVTYDREGSTISTGRAAEYDWQKAFAGADWFHITGITPAISANAAEAAITSVQEAKRRGIVVSCDLNFRQKLWKWKAGVSAESLARGTIAQIMPSVDLVIANEEDADHMLDIRAAESNVNSGHLSVQGYAEVARRIVERYPQVSRVAITLRESHSASHNNWGGLLYDSASDAVHVAPRGPDDAYRPYEIRNIVDRVGAGDSFAGALIFALRTRGLDSPETALRYALAASCLKHSILGDFNYATRPEIEALMHGSASGRVQR
jgi:2-dehydro-3-deoxygluconokinase